MKLKKELEKHPNYDKIICYGTGIYDGMDAVFIYWDKKRELNDNPNKTYEAYDGGMYEEIDGYIVINMDYEGTDIVLPEDGSKYVDERSNYFDEDLNYNGNHKDKLAYPMFLNRAGTKVFWYNYIRDSYINWHNEDGIYTEKYGEKKGEKYDFIKQAYIREATIVDGVAHDERDGWCFQLDIKDDEFDLGDYPRSQFEIALSMEEARSDIKRRITEDMKLYQRTLEYVDQI